MIRKNDEFILEIEDMGVNGEGIGHVDGLALFVKDAHIDRKSTRLNSSHSQQSRMPSSA